jgi:hypothetical protein
VLGTDTMEEPSAGPVTVGRELGTAVVTVACPPALG